MDELFAKIDKEREGRYKQPWAKLDKGSKLNRIHKFVKMEKRDKELTEAQEKKLEFILTQLCDKGALNKVSDIEYKDEEIKNIRNLSYCDEDKSYVYKRDDKKKISHQRSKGNLERHLSKSNDR